MDAELQGVEVETLLVGEHDLAVDHRAGREGLQQRGFELGEITVERFVVPADYLDVLVVPEHDRPETVPLRLVQPAIPGRYLLLQFGEHRGQWWSEGQRHGPGSAVAQPPGTSRSTPVVAPASVRSKRS